MPTGQIRIEGRGFVSEPAYDGQQQHGYSLIAEGFYRRRSEAGFVFTLAPHIRFDEGYSDPLQGDLREFSLFYREDNWSIRIGIGQVRWGASDVFSLIDVINQTDRIHIGEETEKLGQPMIEVSLAPGMGVLDLYVLPFFREQSFPGRRGRLRPRLLIETDNAIYETSSTSRGPDVAARYSHTIGSLDYGLHVFSGRGRTPYLISSSNLPDMLQPMFANEEETLVPFYENIVQVGLDAQWAIREWLWKLEAMYRDGFIDRYYAGIGGFEYAIQLPSVQQRDLRLVAEYAYDQRGKSVTSQTIFDNDLFLGVRLTTGNLAGSSLRGGLTYDLDHGEQVATLRYSRRLGDQNSFSLEGWFLFRPHQDSLLYELRRDHFVRLVWTRYLP